MMGETKSESFTAGDVTRITGLSSRQIGDWDNRAGVLDAKREHRAGWRRFSKEEVLSLSVCAALRSNIPISLEQTAWLYRALTGDSLVEKALKFFTQGERPFLFTNFENKVGVFTADRLAKELHICRAKPSVIYPLQSVFEKTALPASGNRVWRKKT